MDGRDDLGRWVGPITRLCPVCYRRVSPTVPYRNIEPHTDTLGLERCPGAGEPFRIALTAPHGTDRQLRTIA
jgi:hypothetical protein